MPLTDNQKNVLDQALSRYERAQPGRRIRPIDLVLAPRADLRTVIVPFIRQIKAETIQAQQGIAAARRAQDTLLTQTVLDCDIVEGTL